MQLQPQQALEPYDHLAPRRISTLTFLPDEGNKYIMGDFTNLPSFFHLDLFNVHLPCISGHSQVLRGWAESRYHDLLSELPCHEKRPNKPIEIQSGSGIFFGRLLC